MGFTLQHHSSLSLTGPLPANSTSQLPFDQSVADKRCCLPKGGCPCTVWVTFIFHGDCWCRPSRYSISCAGGRKATGSSSSCSSDGLALPYTSLPKSFPTWGFFATPCKDLAAGRASKELKRTSSTTLQPPITKNWASSTRINAR